MNGLSAFIKETPESFPFLSAICGYHEKMAACNLEESPQQNLTMLTP